MRRGRLQELAKAKPRILVDSELAYVPRFMLPGHGAFGVVDGLLFAIHPDGHVAPVTLDL